jgi:hypothetical protein
MILPILQYGDPMLRAKGKRIDEIDDHSSWRTCLRRCMRRT